MTVANAPALNDAVLESMGGDCCDIGAAAIMASTASAERQPQDLTTIADPAAFVRETADGHHSLSLFVDNLQCAACIRTIENGLRTLPGVTEARVNMSTRRVAVEWLGEKTTGQEIARTVASLGYPLAPFNPAQVQKSKASEQRRLLASLAVAGFAAGNVMLLSVSVWSGLVTDMGPATRDMFHWVSALIALPAVAFAGQPFFRSAFSVLKAGRMNMDVPISLAVILASAMSLHQTFLGREHTYFDAAIGLVFFLLIGRYLDFQSRAKARETAEHLVGLSAVAATVIDENGQRRAIPASDVTAGLIVFVAVGDRVPVDGEIIDGRSDVDTSLVTGETLPRDVAPGCGVYAGTLNLTAPLTIRATADGEHTLLAEIVRLIEHAEQGRARFVRIADRAARIYAPAVHILALATFLGWWLIGAAPLEVSVLHAVAVLIITCPCALGLAVPAAQVIASGVLFRRGILVKSGDAFERLAEVDTVVFDKTGTLTTGDLELANAADISPEHLSIATKLAEHSNHPLSRALVRSGQVSESTALEVSEFPGRGLQGTVGGNTVRLGSQAWCDAHTACRDMDGENMDAGPELWLKIDDGEPICFQFVDQSRADAGTVIQGLNTLGLQVMLLSGDRSIVAGKMAEKLGIENWQGECLPTDKIRVLEKLHQEGRKVVMVGDGLNDAPALAAGHASISPATAADVAQTAADFIFQGDKLKPVLTAIRVARRTHALVKQNIAIAVGYNIFAVPIAVLGFASPLVAAVAMSSSSLLVTLNALRLRLVKAA
jgi:P-type Cu2+ transporter